MEGGEEEEKEKEEVEFIRIGGGGTKALVVFNT